MCVLKGYGKFDEARARAVNATVECGVCGEKAINADYVCNPVQLTDTKDN
jgi:hypothetical protein